jgi:hypothetical protein
MYTSLQFKSRQTGNCFTLHTQNLSIMNYRNTYPCCTRHKGLFIISALLVTSLIAAGQASIAVAPNKMNMFYIGVDNTVTVAASGGTDDKVTVSISGGGGTVSKISAGLYNVRVAAVTDACELNVYVDGKLAGTSSFRVRNLPVPLGSIGAHSSGDNVTADLFQKQKGVAIYIKDFPFAVKYEVIGYTFNVHTDNGDVKSANCEGAYFCSEARQFIDQYVKPGATVTIDNIRVKDEGGRELKVPGLIYHIK